MIRSFLVVLMVACVAVAAGQVLAPAPARADDAPNSFIGPNGCKKCHLKEFKSWTKTPMAHAFDVLKPGEAKDKKAASGLDAATDYTKDPKCLKCHTTAYGTAEGYPEVVAGKDWTDAEKARAEMLQGTTCEACHGAGSAYAPYKKEHEDYKLADVQSRGLVAPVTAKQCEVCHEKGGCPTMKPDYAFDFEKSKKSEKDLHEHIPLKKQH